MAKSDAPTWFLVTFLGGLISAYLVSKNSIIALIGGLIVGSIGYLISKGLK